MATCPVCGCEYDERAYQVVIEGLGPFDSIVCADVAIRRRARGLDLPDELIDVISAAHTRSRARQRPVGKDRAH
jgi:hypothetical protein